MNNAEQHCSDNIYQACFINLVDACSIMLQQPLFVRQGEQVVETMLLTIVA